MTIISFMRLGGMFRSVWSTPPQVTADGYQIAGPMYGPTAELLTNRPNDPSTNKPTNLPVDLPTKPTETKTNRPND